MVHCWEVMGQKCVVICGARDELHCSLLSVQFAHSPGALFHPHQSVRQTVLLVGHVFCSDRRYLPCFGVYPMCSSGLDQIPLSGGLFQCLGKVWCYCDQGLVGEIVVVVYGDPVKRF